MKSMALMSRPATGVSNDKRTKAAANEPVMSSNAASKTALSLPEMEKQREQWETTAFRTSNQQLYSVLASCLAYGATLPTAQAKERNKELEAFLKQRRYVVKNDSPLLTRVVKAVFGNVDRRRISTYSLVLRTAQKAGVTSDKLADWIETKGGVQEIRLARSATYVSPKQRAEAAKSTLSSLPTLAIAKDKLNELADAEFCGSECVLLAEQQSDGSFHVKALTRSSTAVNAALAALYAEQKRNAA